MSGLEQGAFLLALVVAIFTTRVNSTISDWKPNAGRRVSAREGVPERVRIDSGAVSWNQLLPVVSTPDLASDANVGALAWIAEFAVRSVGRVDPSARAAALAGWIGQRVGRRVGQEGGKECWH